MDNLANFNYVCKTSELNESEGKRFYINDTDIALFKVNEKIYAVGNICPHQHTAKIYEGFIEDDCVVCPLHGWTFKLDTGNLISGSKGLDAYPIKVINDKIYVKVISKELNW